MQKCLTQKPPILDIYLCKSLLGNRKAIKQTEHGPKRCPIVEIHRLEICNKKISSKPILLKLVLL